MSFTIELGHTSSAANVVDKSFGLYNAPSGVLRKGSSIIDPIVIVECDANEVWRTSCNYAHIPAFGRWYYVTNIVAVQGCHTTQDQWPQPKQLWEFHMHVDVLKSFADEIKLQTAVVARQENNYNLMLDDGFFMCYQNPLFQTKRFNGGDPFENQEFVLIVAGS